MRLSEIAIEHTELSPADIKFFETRFTNFQLAADVMQADLLLYALTREGHLVVLAEAKPHTTHSLYWRSWVGEVRSAKEEPTVVKVLKKGVPAKGPQGIVLGGFPVKQEVFPVKNLAGQVIAALSIEQNTMKQEGYQIKPGILLELGSFIALELPPAIFPSGSRTIGPLHSADGLVAVDNTGIVQYMNPSAVGFYDHFGVSRQLLGNRITALSPDEHLLTEAVARQECMEREIKIGQRVFEQKVIPLIQEGTGIVKGALQIIRDVTEIRAKEKEIQIKAAVIQEIHHRVKNNLQTIASLLRLQSRRIKDYQAKGAIQESINRIMSIAVVHDLLAYSGPEKVEILQVGRTIVSGIIQTMSNPDQNILTNVSGDKIFLPSQQATSVALVVNELVQNSLEHAFTDRNEGEVAVRFRDLGDRVIFYVGDNGVGLSPGFNLFSTPNLGLQIVQTLVYQDLKGEILITSEEGTQFKITFPKLAEKEDT